jgi:type II secretory ATPase GspE/PulE/Tfp pilus assembly ATPase PilB-like protein
MTYTPPEDHDPNIQDPRLGYRIDSGALPVQPDQPTPPVQSGTSSMSPARVAPQEVSSADALLLEQARNVGIPVIENPHHELDPGAVRAIPEETGVLGVGYHDGFLVVAWPRIPRPVEIDEVQSLAGMPIRVAVATETAFQSLWQQADIARKTHLSLVEDILEQALKNNGSDIHLSVGSHEWVDI